MGTGSRAARVPTRPRRTDRGHESAQRLADHPPRLPLFKDYLSSKATSLQRLPPKPKGYPLKAEGAASEDPFAGGDESPSAAVRPRSSDSRSIHSDTWAGTPRLPGQAPCDASAAASDGESDPEDTPPLKVSGFRRSFGALFGCCGAGTHFVHLSFRVKDAFPGGS